MPDIAVVGAGLAGLAAGLTLADAGVDVVVLERARDAGGVIRSEERDGFLFEHAAPGVLVPHPATTPLAARAGVALLPARAAAARRSVLVDGTMLDIPLSAPEVLRSRLLPRTAKARFLAEPFAGRAAGDETVHAFLRRHLGRSFADRLAQPFVSGVFAGDAHRLSAAAAFPALAALEEAGGLVRGGVRRFRAMRASGRARPGLAAPAGGMQQLTAALAEALGPRLRVATPVTHVVPAGSGWAVHTALGTVAARAVVIAAAPWDAAPLVREVDRQLAGVLREIPAAPVAVVGLTAGALPGAERFGFLVGPNEAVGVLGVLVESWTHDHRAPAGRHLLRVLVGGALDAGAVDLDDEALYARAEHAVRAGLGATGALGRFGIVRHTPGIPQYELGHLDRLENIGARLARLPGLLLTGWGYRGIGANAVVADAVAIAGRFKPRGRHAGGGGARASA